MHDVRLSQGRCNAYVCKHGCFVDKSMLLLRLRWVIKSNQSQSKRGEERSLSVRW